jgi:deoxyribodipyrimidine photo-lyase
MSLRCLYTTTTNGLHLVKHLSRTLTITAARMPLATGGDKRGQKRQSSAQTNGQRKRPRDPLREPHPFHQEAEENGIVLRKFYPHEMSNDRARAYRDNELPRPIEVLVDALSDTNSAREEVKVQGAVVHWFKMDLRVNDNRALRLASEKAQEAGVPLITMYIVSPQDFEAHLTAPIRVDFTLRTLEVLRKDLDKLDIPLHVETVDDRKTVPRKIGELMEEWGASHLFANMEYEVDELRREAKLVRQLAAEGRSFDVVHDTCVVPPGELQSGSGNQYAVYTPWYKAWMRHVHGNPELLNLFEPPSKNPSNAREAFSSLFASEIPGEVSGKTLTPDQKKRAHAYFPAGEHEARDRLHKFCEERIGGYADRRNFPSDTGTSSISVHLASGTISARTCVRTARDRNKTKKLDGGSQGIQTWISEVAWRDFYKHVLVHWPYVW